MQNIVIWQLHWMHVNTSLVTNRKQMYLKLMTFVYKKSQENEPQYLPNKLHTKTAERITR